MDVLQQLNCIEKVHTKLGQTKRRQLLMSNGLVKKKIKLNYAKRESFEGIACWLPKYENVSPSFVASAVIGPPV